MHINSMKIGESLLSTSPACLFVVGSVRGLCTLPWSVVSVVLGVWTVQEEQGALVLSRARDRSRCTRLSAGPHTVRDRAPPSSRTSARDVINGPWSSRFPSTGTGRREHNAGARHASRPRYGTAKRSEQKLERVSFKLQNELVINDESDRDREREKVVVEA
ncbi:hypothetical protein ElyMa_003095800 [Elysia marginata]|uniref:Uncharacterized protein n=1 Tax=Elysia marginata TaxID=1093978 RepID=A0AAV4IS62_9GAST|nr:hypothetical protein ElyMa_003095800 [Elysia marginata]